jgi:hypothetical protein
VQGGGGQPVQVGGNRVVKIGQAARLFGLYCGKIEDMGHGGEVLMVDHLYRLHR